MSNIIRFTVWSRIHMEVSPMEYPVQGESWTVFVYSVNITSQSVFLKPSLNSTVVISVKDNGNGITYQLPVDAKGQVTFQYQSSYTDVAFQAFEGNEQSEKIVIGTHFVSSESVGAMFQVNGLLALLTFSFERLAKSKLKIRKVVSVVFVSIMVLFAIVFSFSIYASFFRQTVWGYPENLIGNIVSFIMLEYLTIIGVILLFALGIALGILAVVGRIRK